MVTCDGLASFTCENRTARALAGVAFTMEFLALYLVLTEVRILGYRLCVCVGAHSF
jgi:hypothetical protein